MNDQRQLAALVLESLKAGSVPWRYPHNRIPEFVTMFGQFFTGEPLTEADVDYAELDAIIRATGVKITHHWRCPKPRCDRPPLDRILLPPRSRFIDDRQYHATRIHELIHFLEQPWRVGWVGPADQGELIAECATGMIESHLRLPHDEDNTNVTKWLPAWASAIEANPAYLLDAIAQAERCVSYMHDCRVKLEAA